MPCIFSIKKKNCFPVYLCSQGMLSSILTVKLAKDMPAHQFEATKGFLKTAKIYNMETQQRTLIS